MRFGLIGWAIASGNGGMNSDIVRLASWVTHWLIPEHPKSPNHEPYLENQSGKSLVHCKLSGDHGSYNGFLDAVDGILYVEHPCLKDDYDIVQEAKKRGKLVVGIPMWEWWPERKPWALQTDVLWAVTKFTNRYLKSLSDVLYVHGWMHNWRGRIIGDKWGVNLQDFPFQHRQRASRFVFINGNGGYKLRKASDIVFDAFSMPGAPPLTVYTQQTTVIAQNIPKNVTLIDRNFPHRNDVYQSGDVFLFPSYWEGLCHGIYEGQAVGGLVITTDHPPMNECGTSHLVPVERLSREDLSGKSIVKAHASKVHLHRIASALYDSNIELESLERRKMIERAFNLSTTLTDLYKELCSLPLGARGGH